jgi:hypothetical protein
MTQAADSAGRRQAALDDPVVRRNRRSGLVRGRRPPAARRDRGEEGRQGGHWAPLGCWEVSADWGTRRVLFFLGGRRRRWNCVGSGWLRGVRFLFSS